MNKNNRIFCVGRNYAAHAKELNNAVPDSPVIFMKPVSSIVTEVQSIPYPRHGKIMEQEAELVVQIGKSGCPDSLEEAHTFISAFTLGLDLTLRDLQNSLKQKGLPWEIAKAFDGSAPLGGWVAASEVEDWQNIAFQCYVNDNLRQEGHINDMIFSIPELILFIGRIWSFIPGDMIYTGTPSGVGAIHPGDKIVIKSEQLGLFKWNISSNEP
jgi:2-keto-4-pentenoate hydratase/2-oxohepta-3-ene-1,7-dioic acid hydratase in catechol pathway